MERITKIELTAQDVRDIRKHMEQVQKQIDKEMSISPEFRKYDVIGRAQSYIISMTEAIQQGYVNA